MVSKLEGLKAAIQNAGEGLLYAAQETIFSAAADASTVVWNVRTGDYSGSLGMEQTDAMSISVYFESDHAEPLEYGWTTRDGGFVDSPGVLIPAVMENLDALAGAFQEWLNQQSGS